MTSPNINEQVSRLYAEAEQLKTSSQEVESQLNNLSRSRQELILAKDTLEELEKDYILKTLEQHNWNQKKASDILGISTTTLWRKLKSYGIEPKKKD